jgi:hypothetical protein
MRKNYLILLFLAIACLGFTTCKDDDKDSGSEAALNKLQNNQVSINAEIFDVGSMLGVSPSQGEEPGAYYVDFYPEDENLETDINGKFDIRTPLVGKTINLTNPVGAVGDNQFQVMITTSLMTLYELNVIEGEAHTIIAGNENPISGSRFTECSFSCTHNESGFTLTMHGSISNGTTVAMKLFVPESEIMYWN